MIINQIDNQFFSNMVNEDQVKMRVSDDPKIMAMLSSSIYEHKIRAVIRELSCNALDSHIQAGKVDTPFEVFLPTILEPVFYVKDYGLGLSKEEVKEIYTVYGASTKTNTNTLIGALGLGSKSPYAYTDTFEVISVKDNVRVHYIASKNENNEYQFNLMSETQTDEYNGVTVKMAVKTSDVDNFTREARHVFSSFDYLPSFVGNNITVDNSEYLELKEIKNKVEISNYPSGQFDLYSYMGNVEYVTTIKQEDIEKFVSKNDGVDVKNEDHIKIANAVIGNISSASLYFELGDIEFMPSRERLSLTKHTKEVIYNRLVDSVQDKIKEYCSFYDSIKSIKDVVDLYKNHIRVYRFFENMNMHVLVEELTDYANISNISRAKYNNNFYIAKSVYEKNIHRFKRIMNSSMFVYHADTKHRKFYSNKYGKHNFAKIGYFEITELQRKGLLFVYNDTNKNMTSVIKTAENYYQKGNKLVVVFVNNQKLLNLYKRIATEFLFVEHDVMNYSDFRKQHYVAPDKRVSNYLDKEVIKATRIENGQYYQYSEVDISEGNVFYADRLDSTSENIHTKLARIEFVHLEELSSRYNIMIVFRTTQNAGKIKRFNIKHIEEFEFLYGDTRLERYLTLNRHEHELINNFVDVSSITKPRRLYITRLLSDVVLESVKDVSNFDEVISVLDSVYFNKHKIRLKSNVNPVPIQKDELYKELSRITCIDFVKLSNLIESETDRLETNPTVARYKNLYESCYHIDSYNKVLELVKFKLKTEGVL